MDRKYLMATTMLNYESEKIKSLISKRNWKELDEFNKIRAIYSFVQNEILFGYNASDHLTATQVLSDGIGQCNTKATLLMALLRAVGIPCRLHASKVTKDFQKGATNTIIALLAPNFIVHTWVEVYFNEAWLALEGVILDKKYLISLQQKYPNQKGMFKGYAVATNCFDNPPVDWNGHDTFIQKEAIVFDYGIFSSPDDFFATHEQDLCVFKKFIYSHIARQIMTRNVAKIRNIAAGNRE